MTTTSTRGRVVNQRAVVTRETESREEPRAAARDRHDWCWTHGHNVHVSIQCPTALCICACPTPSLTCEHVRCETSTQGRASLFPQPSPNTPTTGNGTLPPTEPRPACSSSATFHATSRSSHSRSSLSCRFILAVASLFSASFCDARRRRLPIPLPCSRGFSRLSAQLRPPRGVFWPLEFIALRAVWPRASSFPRDSSFVSNYYTAEQALVRAEAEPQARAGTAMTQPLYGPPAGSVMTQPLYLPANPMMSYAAANSPALLLSDDPTVANVRTVCSASAALVVHMCPGENDCNPNQIEIGDTAR